MAQTEPRRDAPAPTPSTPPCCVRPSWWPALRPRSCDADAATPNAARRPVAVSGTDTGRADRGRGTAARCIKSPVAIPNALTTGAGTGHHMVGVVKRPRIGPAALI